MSLPQITVIGATGNVGRKVVAQLLQKHLATQQTLTLMASAASAGKKIHIDGHDFVIQEANKQAFSGSDICIFNTESDVSEHYVPLALAAGAYVVDSSSHYRLQALVPLIIPPVNHHLISRQQKLYAHANCLASPIATVLFPLDQQFIVRRAHAVTYQSTSGAGKGPMDELWSETKNMVDKTPYSRVHFPRQIAFNVIPQVGNFLPDGFTYEEFKIIREVQKVVREEIAMTATAVRVPVMVGHAIALTVEFEKEYSMQQIEELLANAPSVKLSKDHFHTPVEVEGQDDVFVGRLRRDPTTANGLHLWLCSDNLRRGAATDAVEIAGTIISQCY